MHIRLIFCFGMLCLIFSNKLFAAPVVSTLSDGRVQLQYEVTDDSYYNVFYAYDDEYGNPGYVDRARSVSGIFSITLEPLYFLYNDEHRISISFAGLSNYPSALNDTTFDLLVSTEALQSGNIQFGMSGEPDYQFYGNGNFDQSNGLVPFICVECSYSFELNLAYLQYFQFGAAIGAFNTVSQESNPNLLRYFEGNPYDTGQEALVLTVGEVPLPASVWLFASALLGLLGRARCHHRQARL